MTYIMKLWQYIIACRNERKKTRAFIYQERQLDVKKHDCVNNIYMISGQTIIEFKQPTKKEVIFARNS